MGIIRVFGRSKKELQTLYRVNPIKKYIYIFFRLSVLENLLILAHVYVLRFRNLQLLLVRVPLILNPVAEYL